MRRIEYKIVTQDQHGGNEEIVAVYARDINSGFRKALALQLRTQPKGWELVSISFWGDPMTRVHVDTTVSTQPIRVRTVAYYNATYTGPSEFYSGIANGAAVTVKVEISAYSHDSEQRVKCGSPVLSIQDAENPGGWLCLYDSYERLENLQPE